MTKLIINIMDWIHGFITNLFPAVTMTMNNGNGVLNAISTVTDFIRQINFIVPLPTVSFILGFILAYRLASVIAFIANWVFRRIMDIIP